MRLHLFALAAMLASAPPQAMPACVEPDRRWEAWIRPRVRHASVGWSRVVRPWDGKLCTWDDVRYAEECGYVADARRMARALDKRERRARRGAR